MAKDERFNDPTTKTNTPVIAEQHSTKESHKLKIRGVIPMPNGRFKAQIHFEGRTRSLGHYSDQESAAKAYDDAKLTACKSGSPKRKVQFNFPKNENNAEMIARYSKKPRSRSKRAITTAFNNKFKNQIETPAYNYVVDSDLESLYDAITTPDISEEQMTNYLQEQKNKRPRYT